MEGSRSRHVVIAGAGIAGLTAALAFAAGGFSVTVFERAARLEEVGAGIQLSPNATRLLERLGVLEKLLPVSVRPEAVVLRKAATLAELARVPMGEAAERRWGSPYIAVHRADLQGALAETAAGLDAIEIVTGAKVRSAILRPDGIDVSAEMADGARKVAGVLLIGADGVWSTVRQAVGQDNSSRFSGELAWRATIAADSAAGAAFREVAPLDVVTALLHPGFHLIAYPVRSGKAVNLAAFTPGKAIAEGWSREADPALLSRSMRGTHPALQRLAGEAAPWTAWPVHSVTPEGPWSSAGRIALIGDAAHAMTPFAAQGAAMAIEDAVTLADAVVIGTPEAGFADALSRWEAARKPRVRRVARRGALNRFAWHAGGPVALVRDLFVKLRPPQKLAADLDWLYGWEPPARS